MPESGKRNFTRVPFKSSVSFKNEETLFQGTLVDISLKGIALEVQGDAKVPDDQIFHLILPLQGSEDKTIEMNIRSIHTKGKIIGFKWESVDLDSFYHLRRLLEINFQDQSLLDRELTTLVIKE